MPLTQLTPPYPIFTDKNGSPLDAGYLYFGTANLNPETNPIQVYYDSTLTQPAAQPLRTSNGYVMRNGSPALIYANEQFSVTVRNKNSELVIYSPVGYGIIPASFVNTNQMTYNQGGTGAVSRILTSRLQDFVSVNDFGAVGDWNGTQSVPGTGTDDTAAIQSAINYCVANGVGLFFPPGRYRTTAPLVIDRSFNTEDPTSGGMFGIALEGADPASCQIASDHNGACISFIGGAGAGWHTYFTFSGIGLLKANYARNAGSIGLKMDQSVYFNIQNFDMSFFEYGIYGTDCLSGSFSTGSIRLNNYGFKFLKGTRSHPNNISFRGVITLNNQIYGGSLIKPSTFNYIGGSIESNGYTGILADPNSWGLYVEQPGSEGAVGINLNGTYIENNNGKADVWIVSTTTAVTNVSMNTFSGCSFLRFSDTRYVTNNILLDGANPSLVSISGCGFKDYAPYVSSAARLWVATGNSQVLDAGGNLLCDTTGGLVGLSVSVFAPIGSYHQIPFASLPSASRFRNGIQYCADGTGSSLPSLAVSDGTNWWQIPLGQFSGRVASAGTSLRLPRGWSCTKTGTGIYVVTHNLALSPNTYAVVATPSGAAGLGYCSGMALSSNTFEIYFANTAGAATDMDFNFTMNII